MVVAFVLTSGHSAKDQLGTGAGSAAASGPLPAVTVAAPPTPAASTQAACVKVLAGLPVQLGTAAPRRTATDSSFVAAWGDPAIVLRCGVAKPAIFGTAAAPQPLDVNNVIWQPDLQKSQTVYTTIDRSVYIEVTVPAGADQPLPLLAPAVSALKQVCTATDAAGNVGADLPICR